MERLCKLGIKIRTPKRLSRISKLQHNRTKARNKLMLRTYLTNFVNALLSCIEQSVGFTYWVFINYWSYTPVLYVFLYILLYTAPFCNLSIGVLILVYSNKMQIRFGTVFFTTIYWIAFVPFISFNCWIKMEGNSKIYSILLF